MHRRPETIDLAPNVAADTLSAGYAGALAIDSNGRLYGWAWNGLSPTDPIVGTLSHPEAISLTASAISAGGEHSLAIGTQAATYSATALIGLLEAIAGIGVLVAVLARRSGHIQNIQSLPEPISPYDAAPGLG
jgi:hypothetical protein